MAHPRPPPIFWLIIPATPLPVCPKSPSASLHHRRHGSQALGSGPRAPSSQDRCGVGEGGRGLGGLGHGKETAGVQIFLERQKHVGGARAQWEPGGCLTLPVLGLLVAMGPPLTQKWGSRLNPTHGILLQASLPPLPVSWAFHTSHHRPAFGPPSLGFPGPHLPGEPCKGPRSRRQGNRHCLSGGTAGVALKRGLRDGLPGSVRPGRAPSGAHPPPSPAATLPAPHSSPPLLGLGVSPYFPA